jgi:HemY protein
MRKLILYAVILVLAVWAGIYLSKDPGYVLISYHKWTAETSIWFALIAVLVLFGVLYYLLRFFYLLAKTHGHILRWHKQKQFVKAHTVTGAGLLALEEADWQSAESLLLKGVASSTIPVVNYLNAAKAAQEQGNYKKRDKYLEKALTIADGKEKLAVRLMKATLQLEHRQFDEALATLQKLKIQMPKHAHVLRQLQQVYVALEKWSELLEMLPLLRKRKVLEPEAQQQLEQAVYCKLFNKGGMNNKELRKLWKTVSKQQQLNSAIALAYVRQLMKVVQLDEAESVISNVLEEQFSERLVKCYGKLHKVSASKRLAKAESWLQKYGESVVLLTALCRIALDNNEPTKAKGFVERSLQIEETTVAYSLLASVYERKADQKACSQALNKALLLMK